MMISAERFDIEQSYRIGLPLTLRDVPHGRLGEIRHARLQRTSPFTKMHYAQKNFHSVLALLFDMLIRFRADMLVTNDAAWWQLRTRDTRVGMKSRHDIRLIKYVKFKIDDDADATRDYLILRWFYWFWTSLSL